MTTILDIGDLFSTKMASDVAAYEDDNNTKATTTISVPQANIVYEINVNYQYTIMPFLVLCNKDLTRSLEEENSSKIYQISSGRDTGIILNNNINEHPNYKNNINSHFRGDKFYNKPHYLVMLNTHDMISGEKTGQKIGIIWKEFCKSINSPKMYYRQKT